MALSPAPPLPESSGEGSATVALSPALPPLDLAAPPADQQLPMPPSWESWGRGGRWENQWWSASDWQPDSDSWQANSDQSSDSKPAAQQASSWEPAGSPCNAKSSRTLRRVSTDEGKEYCNRTYLGGEERTSVTREDRLKLAWAAIRTLEPDVEQMWKPQLFTSDACHKKRGFRLVRPVVL